MTNNDHTELVQLIAKYAQGILTAAEEERLRRWAADDELVSQLMDSYAPDNPAVARRMVGLESIPKSRDWEEIKRRYRARRRQLRSWVMASGAAAAVLVALVTWFFMPPIRSDGVVADHVYGHVNDISPGGSRATLTLSDGKQVDLGKNATTLLHDQSVTINLKEDLLAYNEDEAASLPTDAYHQLSVPVRGTYHLILADGTQVWLNAASKLRFPVSFNGMDREVILEGEAYFDVAKNQGKSFTVVVNGSRIEALGTAFNVNGRSPGNAVKTILTEGKIRVSSDAGERVITPGYAVISNAKGMQVLPADVEEALAWKDGYFYFNKGQMPEILQEIARWYGVEIDDSVAWGDKRYIGGIKRTVTLGAVCELLARLTGREYIIAGKKLTVR